MATIPTRIAAPADQAELYSGDRMTREEFHRIYERMPANFRAELIGGIVYVASPLKRPHSIIHVDLGTMFGHYRGNTPGVEAGDNGTILLGEEGEPQPDLYLRILPEFGGQSQTTAEDYVEGAPESIAEIAHSSRAIDLHRKREDYARYGVLEYVVVCLREQQVHWFDLPANRELPLDADGVLRMRTFPGLWIHVAALFANDYPRLMATLAEGLATVEHAAFVQRLAVARSHGGKKPPRGRKQPKGKRSNH